MAPVHFTDEQKKRIFDALVEICGKRIRLYENMPSREALALDAASAAAWWYAAHALADELLGVSYDQQTLTLAIAERVNR